MSSRGDMNETSDEIKQGGPAIRAVLEILEPLHPVTRWRVLNGTWAFYAASGGLRKPTEHDGRPVPEAPKEPA